MDKIFTLILTSLSILILFSSCSDENDNNVINTSHLCFNISTQNIEEESSSQQKKSRVCHYDVDSISINEFKQPLYLQTIELDTITKPLQRNTRKPHITTETLNNFKLYVFEAQKWDINAPVRQGGEGIKVHKTKKNLWETSLEWNPNCEVRCAAIAPYDVPGLTLPNNPLAKDLTLKYVQQITPEEQEDLLFTGFSEQHSSSNHQPFKLIFSHLLTEIQFRIGKGLPKNLKIKKIAFSNLHKEGIYTYDNQQKKWNWNLNDTKGVKVIYKWEEPKSATGETGTEITHDNIRFRLLPQKVDDITLHITYSYTSSGEEEKTLEIPLKGKNEWREGHSVWYTLSNSFDAENHFEVFQGKKEELKPLSNIQKHSLLKENSKDSKKAILYEILTDGSIIQKKRIEELLMKPEDQIKIESYITLSPRAFGEEVKLPVPYTVEYSKDKQTWYTKLEFINKFKRFLHEGPEKNNDPKSQGDIYSLRLFSNRNVDEQSTTINLKNQAEVHNYDLSTDGGKSSQNTANCYIINAAGTYCLPLVYGNAIKNGSENAAAYKTTQKNSIQYTTGKKGMPLMLENFVDYKGNKITSPYISGAKGAKLLWEDEPGIINKVWLENNKLYFEIKKEDICQGNASIAITDNDDKIMWSWHIWITNYKLAEDDVLVYNHKDKYTGLQYVNTLMKYNLGFCPKDENQDDVQPRTCYMRIKQYRRDGEVWKKLPINGERNYTIKQKGGQDVKTESNSCLYQWGRKDPFPGLLVLQLGAENEPGLIESKPIYGKEESYLQIEKVSEKPLYYGIQNPDIFFLSKEGTIKADESGVHEMGNWINKYYWNLWNNNNNTWMNNFIQKQKHIDLAEGMKYIGANLKKTKEKLETDRTKYEEQENTKRAEKKKWVETKSATETNLKTFEIWKTNEENTLNVMENYFNNNQDYAYNGKGQLYHEDSPYRYIQEKDKDKYKKYLEDHQFKEFKDTYWFVNNKPGSTAITEKLAYDKSGKLIESPEYAELKQKMLDEKSNKITELQTNIKKEQDYLEAVIGAIKKLETEIKALQNKIIKINKEIEGLSLKSQKANKEIEALRAAIERAQEKYDYLHHSVKTIYDPCPKGYCVPIFDAFTGFTPNGSYIDFAQEAEETQNKYIIVSDDKMTISFWCNINKRNPGDPLISFPITSFRSGSDGELATPAQGTGWTKLVTTDGYYFTSGTYDQNRFGGEFSFNGIEISPYFGTFMTNGRCIRPMKEGSTKRIDANSNINPIEWTNEDYFIHLSK